jgi:hypothetical protein
MTGADHKERRTGIMHEKAHEVTTKPDSTPIDTTQLVLLDSVDPPYTAIAAKFERPAEADLQLLEMSLSVFDCSAKERIPLRGNHPIHSIIVELHADLKHAVVVIQMMSGTSAANIPRWRSRYQNSIIQEVDGEQRTTPQDLVTKFRDARLAHKENVEILFGRPQMSSMM